MEPNAQLSQRRATWSLMSKIRGDQLGAVVTSQICFPSAPLLFRFSRGIFSDKEIVPNCIKIFGNLFTIITVCHHSALLTNVAILHC